MFYFSLRNKAHTHGNTNNIRPRCYLKVGREYERTGWIEFVFLAHYTRNHIVITTIYY